MAVSSTKRRITLSLIGIGIVLLIVLALFQPWRLFTSTTVIEAAPDLGTPTGTSRPAISSTADRSTAPPRSPQATVVSSGRFVSQEHHTTGSVRLIRTADGGHLVRLDGLETSDGPDLHVWLSDQAVRPGLQGAGAFDDGRYVDLGPLKGNRGDQNYPVPNATDVSGLTSVTIWCARFHVSFGAAALAA